VNAPIFRNVRNRESRLLFMWNHLRHQYRALQQKKQEAAQLDGPCDFSVMLP